MSESQSLAELLVQRSEDVRQRWLESHLSAVSLRSEREIVRQIHERSPSLIEAWAVALSGPHPDDTASFDHREVVQLIASMAHALAEADVTATTAEALVTSLGWACERLGATEVFGPLMPLASVAAESYVTARLSRVRREELERLARTTPVLGLPGGVTVVSACGAPDRRAADEVVDRCLRRILSSATSPPLVVLDMSHLETVEADVVASFLGLAADVGGLDGACTVTGMSDSARELAEQAGIDLSELRIQESLDTALDEFLHPGLLRRVKRALRS